MTPQIKDTLWFAYRSIKRCQRLGNILAAVCFTVSVVCVFMNRPDAAITAGIISALSIFHSEHCRHNAKEIRQAMFNHITPDREA